MTKGGERISEVSMDHIVMFSIKYNDFNPEGSPYGLLYEQAYKRDLKIVYSNVLNSGNHAFDAGQNFILIPQNDPFDVSHAFGIAHEIGHFDSNRRRSSQVMKIFYYCIQNRDRYTPFIFPFVLYDEIAAWNNGFKLCKQSNVSIRGYRYHACKGVWSYLINYLTIIFWEILLFVLLAASSFMINYYGSSDWTWRDVFSPSLLITFFIIHIVRICFLYKDFHTSYTSER
jgi:hypothetical protein